MHIRLTECLAFCPPVIPNLIDIDFKLSWYAPGIGRSAALKSMNIE